MLPHINSRVNTNFEKNPAFAKLIYIDWRNRAAALPAVPFFMSAPFSKAGFFCAVDCSFAGYVLY